MIAKMRKLTVLAAPRDRDRLAQRLYDLGAVHLSGTPMAEGQQQLAAAKAEVDQFDAAIAALKLRIEAGVAESGTAPSSLPQAIAAEVRAAVQQVAEAERALVPLAAERAAAAPFGAFSLEAFVALQRSGVSLALYQFPRSSPPEVPAGASLHELSEVDGTVSAVLVSRSRVELELRPTALPPRDVAAVDAEIAAVTARLGAARAVLDRSVPALPALHAAREDASHRLELATASATMAPHGPVVALQGFVPEANERELADALAREPVAVFFADVTSDDAVPTLLHSSPFVRQVHTVFQGIGIVPGYAEADVSSLFLVFLLLFAAMLIGDAGYGSILVGLGLFAAMKTKGKPGGVPQAVRLLLSTGVATMVWGAITATWFAIPDLPAALASMKVEWLAPDDKITATKNIMLLCFLLGAVHLTLAHLWAAVRCGRTPQALAQLGWIGCTWLMFLLARNMVLGEDLPGFVTTLAIASIAAVALFMTPLKAIKTEWFNHVMLPLSLVSNFVDVVSYLRLFAVGSAGVAVAVSFNDMAAKAAEGGGLNWLTAAFVACFGHTLNLLLAAMAVLVHGVRLNTLEFSAHLGLQWSGVPFRPFGRRTAAATHGARAMTETNGSED